MYVVEKNMKIGYKLIENLRLKIYEKKVVWLMEFEK